MAVLSRMIALLAATAISAYPLAPRGSIASDEVVGFAQTVPSGTTGSVYLAYQPHLYVANGCVPFPAVDASGNTKYAPPFPSSQRHSPN
jgi:hypothetical protein